MAIDDIIKQIEQDAKAEAETLLSNAGAEAEAILEKARREAKKLRAEETEKTQQKAREHRRRIETLAGLDIRKEILKAKKSIIEDAFLKSEERIVGLPHNEYRAFLKPIILKAVESGNEEIVTSTLHRDAFTPDFIQDLNGELSSMKASLRLSDEVGNFTGGFILRDGRKETNLTLRSLIAEKRDQLEPKVAKILFGENT